MTKTFMSLIFTSLVVLTLVACETAASDAQKHILEAEAAQANAAEATAQEIGIQGEPEVLADAQASGGRAFEFLRTDDQLTWDISDLRLEGHFELLVSARAVPYKGDPELELQLSDQKVTRAVSSPSYESVSFGVFDLTNAPSITLRFTNDLWEGAQEKDRNLIVDYISVLPTDMPTDAPQDDEPAPEVPQDDPPQDDPPQDDPADPSTDIPADEGLVEAEIPEPADNNNGYFRVYCDFSHALYDDPIVYPGQVDASHLHMFFGNTGADASSSYESLMQADDSTCQGGRRNRSSYWMPALLNLDGIPQIPDPLKLYYKSSVVDPKTVEAIPPGLKMIARRAQADGGEDKGFWNCGGSPDNKDSESTPYIPECDQGESLHMSIKFPNCWNGVDLDSADHQAHMAYREGSSCPASHPVPIPQITFVTKWSNLSSSTKGWRLSSDEPDEPGGASLHGDFYDGWHRETVQTWLENCIHGGLNCSRGNLGNGTALSPISEGAHTLPSLDILLNINIDKSQTCGEPSLAELGNIKGG